MTTKTKRIPELHVGRGQQVGPLTVFPVWTGAPAIAGLVMGLAAEVSVAEREGSPVVGELIVTNNGREPALLVEGANAQMVRIVEALRDRFDAQRSRGSSFLIGDSLSALDIYWATFAGAIEPFPPELCPNMPEPMRQAYTDPNLRVIGGDALFAHRDRIYREYLKLPMLF